MERFLGRLGINNEDYHVSREKYRDIGSNKQFGAFYGKHKFYLDMLIYAFARTSVPRLANDTEIYAALKKSMRKSTDLEYAAKAAASVIYHYIRKYAGDVKSYLDLGCGQCIITREVAARIGITGHGADMEEEFEDAWNNRPKEVKFAVITDKNVLGHDGEWDLITATMVLHHIPALEKTVEAIVSALSPGGILILKEHDCFTDIEAMLVDIEHCLYIVQNNDEWRGKIRAQYIKCFNWIEWAFKFKDLELLHHGPWGYPAESFGLTRKSILVFKKK